MKTLQLTSGDEDIRAAAALLGSDEIVVFPTETVYGLGARADSPDAVGKIFRAKSRPADNPLIVHVNSVDMALEYCRDLSPVERDLFTAFSPGPFTLILPRKAGRGEAAAAGNDSIGLRIPRHPTALKLIAELGSGIAAPSANRSGRPSPTDYTMALHEMDGRVAAIIDGGNSDKGLESTIVRCTASAVYVLRPGSVTVDDLKWELNERGHDIPVLLHGSPSADGGGIGSIGRAEVIQPPAPGTRYRHYAPAARVLLYRDAAELAAILKEVPADKLEIIPPVRGPYDGGGYEFISSRTEAVISKAGKGILVHRFRDMDEYAHHLYRLFIAADSRDAEIIAAWLPPERTQTHALRDRLKRAAQS